MANFDLPLVFGFGLLGSLHCVQMCGPIVLAYSLPFARAQAAIERRNLLLAHLAYNAGRITTYSVLGAVAGAAGHALGLIGRLAGVGDAAAIIAGIFLVLMGLSFAGILPMSAAMRLDPTRLLGRGHQAVGRLLAASSCGGKFALGLALGLLPCGFLYAGLLKAMETGNPFLGAATMLVFGLGTAGAMISVGLVSSLVTVPLRRWGNVIAAAGVVCLGALLIYRGVMGRGMLAHLDQGGGSSIHGHH